MSKILVVEDSKTQREMIANLLQNNQFEVVTAKNGVEAIAQAEVLHPDLAILDIVMPEMNGYELCRKLRDNPETWNISIVICSSKCTKADRHWGYRQGANAYIGKPFLPDELMNTVRTLLRIS
ncbi:response regulator [Pseudanabaena galeata UHCC 0370]|jgi:twitching motility two-component system response regulator PilH|uniref:Response regulator n=1 Tax=Pseudanabaena galeata UHCC 0370 TaxID=3110310 RepID=A0ABU5TPN4_9CYAN|nr:MULTISPECIES: response regulator [Pseudanabaena]MEA5480271.1 response regulator [Pseudanabaena galeata UHCC 0370]MEA5487827.1 response regulator [Pseudanabaena sp. CCNP1317]WGS74435.1 response regulator [Pseudanabaena galeata CCNP1313]